MIQTDDMLSFVPKIKEGYIYYQREEDDSKIRIKTKYNEGIEQLVNHTFMDVIEMFDGKNSIANIIEHFQLKYPKIKKENFEKDILYIVNNLNKLQALQNFENPFISVLSKKISKHDEIFMCSYNLLETLICYFQNSNNNYQIKYGNPINFYSKTDILKNRAMSSLETYNIIFGIKRAGEIKGVIIWSSERSNNIVLDSIVSDDINLDIGKVLIVSAMFCVKILKQGEIKARININPSNDPFNLEYILSEGPFNHVIYKKKELQGDVDVVEYTMYC